MMMRIGNLMALSVLSVILIAPASTTVAAPARVGVAVSIRIGPPVLPVYAQPICPGRGYVWEPGYWAYGPDGYFWVPGMWVLPPRVGLLWTPGYWAFDGGFYHWHTGYWGMTVGFYGGIDYGFGYSGTGFHGGYWRGGEYFYNTRVTNVDTTVIHNVYNAPVANEHGGSHVSFNGGPHGIHLQPTAAERSAAHESHAAMTRAQLRHQESASSSRTMLASVNHGRPDVAATARPEVSNRREPRSERSVTENNSSKGKSAANERRANATPAPTHSVAHSTTPIHHAAPTHTAPTEKNRSSKPSSSHSSHAAAPAPSRTTKHKSAPPKPAASHNERPAPRASSPAASHSAKAEHSEATNPSPHGKVNERPASKARNPQPHQEPSHSQPSHTQEQPKHTQPSHASKPHSAPAHPTETQKPEHPQH